MRHRLARILELFKKQPSKEADNVTEDPTSSDTTRPDPIRDDDACEEIPEGQEGEGL